MAEDRLDDWVKVLREEYHRPPETPRDEMWTVIEAGLGARDEDVIPLGEERARRAVSPRRAMGWAVAAAALIVLGVGIGRMTAPVGPSAPNAAAAPDAPGETGVEAPALRLAALEHLGRMETLLAMVRVDAPSGRMDPQVGLWATGLLSQTRLLLDQSTVGDPTMRALLEDLELVLVQIVGASELALDDARASAEMSLTLDAIEQREVLSRIHAYGPTRPVLAGA